MRKPTKSSMTRKLDKICSDLVRSRGICERCGPARYYEFSELQCAHIYSRTYRSVRWDLLNLLSLCAGCHIGFAHKKPLEFAEWVRSYLGEHKYIELKARANSIKKWSLTEMIEYLETLKGTYER